eukprot:SAG31_NODE_16241_length_717_cov_0.970874_2_plen_50_part_01
MHPAGTCSVAIDAFLKNSVAVGTVAVYIQPVGTWYMYLNLGTYGCRYTDI